MVERRINVRCNNLSSYGSVVVVGNLACLLNRFSHNCHDQSKFHGVEWLYLNDETLTSHPELFQAALHHHQTTNLHHPEAWIGGIHKMDRLYKAEMVCDWAARSSEFGKDLRDWIIQRATKKFDFNHFVDMLLDKAFN